MSDDKRFLIDFGLKGERKIIHCPTCDSDQVFNRFNNEHNEFMCQICLLEKLSTTCELAANVLADIMHDRLMANREGLTDKDRVER